MASAAGKHRTKVKDDLFLYGITPESSEAKLRPSGSLSAGTRPKTKSKTISRYSYFWGYEDKERSWGS